MTKQGATLYDHSQPDSVTGFMLAIEFSLHYILYSQNAVIASKTREWYSWTSQQHIFNIYVSFEQNVSKSLVF